MPAVREPRNRGPAAAAANRAAILAAARRLFAEQGYRVPLSAIARAAGVGQGVMYRHFPDRLELAWAVFADNFAELEQVAGSTPGPDCFQALWQRLVAYTVESSAFVEMVVETRAKVPDTVSRRFEELVAEPLARAQAAGLADPAWTTEDILLVEDMVYGVVIAQPDRTLVMDAVRRALALVDRRLAEFG